MLRQRLKQTHPPGWKDDLPGEKIFGGIDSRRAASVWIYYDGRSTTWVDELVLGAADCEVCSLRLLAHRLLLKKRGHDSKDFVCNGFLTAFK